VRLTDAEAARDIYQNDPRIPFPALDHKPDGSCVYLDRLLGCTIYALRPEVCRSFHCGQWWRGLSADEQHSILANGPQPLLDIATAGERHQPG